MNKFCIYSILLNLCFISAAINAKAENDVDWTSFSFEIQNPLPVKRDDLICIKDSDVRFDINNKQGYVVNINGQLVDSQITQCFHDNDDLGLAFLYPLNANESQTVNVFIKSGSSIIATSKPKTSAELLVRVGGSWQGNKLHGGNYISVDEYTVPKDHEIGNKLFKYEGVGWESEQVAYRYYFDERGAIDIFGKQKNGLVLNEVGIDGDDYHVLDDWGMDILKVGPSLGLGGIAAWHENKLIGANNFSDLSVKIAAGNLRSSIAFNYQNWLVDDEKRDLNLTLSISANSLLTHVKAETSAQVEQFATGIVKHGVEQLHLIDKTGTWSYLATWGKQSLNNDYLGMAIIFKTKQLSMLSDDKYNEISVFKPLKQPLYYYLAAHWDKSVGGAKNKEQYIKQLQQSLAQLNNPVIVKNNIN